MKSVVERIFDKIVRIPIAGCWVYTGAVTDFGYGIIGLGTRKQGIDRTHRVIYRHFVGEIPPKMFVCHRCDVPSCCNPSHLFLGTNQDNVNDMIAKGRNSLPPRNPHVVGSKHPLSKFTEDAVRTIKADYNAGKSIYRLAKEHKVAQSTMQRIIHGKRYKNA